MKRFLVTAALTMVALSAGSAFAQEVPHFKELDDNGNGQIAVEKAIATGVPAGMAIGQDINDDGHLTLEDWIYLKKRMKAF